MQINKYIDYLLVFLLIAISGNPFFCYWGLSPIILLFVFLLVVTIRGHYKLIIKGLVSMRYYLLSFVALFIMQMILCEGIYVPSQISYLLRIVVAGLLYIYYGGRFKYLYFNIIFIISAISLFMFPLVLSGLQFDSPFGSGFSDRAPHSIIVYNYAIDFNFGRNFGMFWEPGAFACFICISVLFFVNEIKDFIYKHKLKSLVILLALLTTQSTTGYIALALIAIFTFSKISNYITIKVLLALSIIFVIFTSDIVVEKFKQDVDVTSGMSLNKRYYFEGYTSENRIGTIFFLYPIFKIHPIIGNGVNKEALYYSMPALLREDHLGFGNGFMLYLSRLGLMGFFIFLGYIIRYWKVSMPEKVFSIILIILLLQGEDLLIYPLFMGFPFVKHLNKNKNSPKNMVIIH